MADEERLIVSLEARINQFEKNMARASQTAGKQFGSIEGRAKLSASKLESSFTTASTRVGASLKGMASGLLAGVSLQAAQKLIDAATRISNSLKVAGLSGTDLTKVYDALFDSAQRNAAPLEALVTLYGRAAQQQKELGVSSEQLLSFTEDVAVALRVAGTDASQASGALLQLGQALGSGTVHAEEFNSILEGVPTIAQAAASGIKEANGSVAALKQLVVDGKVSSKAFFDGFAAGAETLQAKVAGATMTTSQGFTILTNSLIRAAGKFDTATETSKRFGAILGDLAAYVDQLNFDRLMGNLDALAAKLNALNGLAQNFGESIGQALGTDNLGKWLATTKLGQAIGMTSPAGVRDRMAGDVPQADAVIQQWAKQHYGNGAATTTTPKTDRLPAATKTEQITLADYPVTGGGRGKGAGTKGKGADDYAREVEQIQKRIASLRAETAAQAGVNPLVDDYGAAVEKARIKQELLNAAQAAGKTITPELAASIDTLAQNYADASVDAAKLAEAQDKTKESAHEWAGLGKDVLGGFISDLRSGKSAAEALAGALDKIADKLLDMALNSLFSSAGGGIFGLFGGLLGFSKGGIVHLAGGGHVRGPGTGTSDSVPAMLSDGEFVVRAEQATKHRALLQAINDGSLPALASGGPLDGRNVGRLHRPANDNPAQVINLPVSVTVNAQGGDRSANADLARQTARETQDAVRAIVQGELRTAMRPGGVLRGR
ncbi:tape measure protein [Mesorhizobium sp. M0771]|uniref:tape measure protein n=1 Tax=Mesorhizobium sp. M0771 TaxID=2956997 RepID=UPI0033375A3E